MLLMPLNILAHSGLARQALRSGIEVIMNRDKLIQSCVLLSGRFIKEPESRCMDLLI
jgi:hypothetical protein